MGFQRKMSGVGSELSELSTWFWNPDIWLPPNISWDTFKEEKVLNSTTVIKPEHFARFSDLLYPLPLGLCFIVIRFFIEKVLLKPIGCSLGLSDKARRQPKENKVLESYFQSKSKLSKGDAVSLSRQSGLSEIQVERWFREKRRANLPTTLTKFCEGGWRLVFYSVMFVYGLGVLYNKPWLWDVGACWQEYPYHTVGWDIWLYYMIEISFYVSLSMTLFIDVKRKDFMQNVLHHAVTILLLAFSWSCHFIRIGTVVLILHDCADPLLELAKLLKYAGRQQKAEIVFGCFTLVWTFTRCYLFPTRVLYSTLHAAEEYIDMFPAYYIFNTLLISLQFLNVVWTVQILRMAVVGLLKGNVEDERSDSEDYSSEEEGKKSN